MLSYDFCANDFYGGDASKFGEVRAAAVRCLELQTNETLNTIMLQLVQAFRYENFRNPTLGKFLLKCTAKDETLANAFHWYVKVEKDNKDASEKMRNEYERLYNMFFDKITEENPAIADLLDGQLELRGKLLDVSNYIKQLKKEKIAGKKKAL